MNLGGATRQITLENSATIGGVVSNGALTLNASDSSRILTLSNSNTYTGETTVESGTLRVSGTGALGASNVTVASGAFLDVQAGGSIANSPSILVNGTLQNASQLAIGVGNAFGGNGAVTGDLHFDAGANFLFNPAATLNVSGDVSFDGFSISNLIGFDTSVNNGVYTLISGNVNMTNVDTSVFNMADGRFASLDGGSLTLTVIPEPSALALVLVAFGASLASIRHKKR